MVLGALISSCGYLSLWRLETLATSGVVGVGGVGVGGGPQEEEPKVPFSLVCLSAFFAANGATFLDCSALATAVRNHRGAQRGGAVGALKAAVGLSGSLFATAFLALFSGDAPRFLLFLAAAPLALAVASSVFVNVVPFEQDDEVGVVTAAPVAAAVAVGAAPSSASPLAAAAATTTPPTPPPTTTTNALPSSSSPSPFDLLQPSSRVAASAGVLLLLAFYVMGATLVLRGPGGPAPLSKEARVSLSLGLAAAAGGVALLPSWGSGLWARRPPSKVCCCFSAGGGGGESGVEVEVEEEEEEEEEEDEEEEEEESFSESFSESEEGGDGGERGEEIERGERAGGAGTPLQRSLLPPPQQRERNLPLPPAPPSRPPPVLRDSSFWLLFVAVTSGSAAGLSFINNAAQIAASAGVAESTPVLVSAFSVANCVGRLSFGSFSERALHSSGGRLPRPLVLAVAGLVASAASAALAVLRSAEPAPLPPSPPPPLPLSDGVFFFSPSPPAGAAASSSSSSLLLTAVAACSGAAFGGIWSLMAAATADLFGVRRYASTYALLLVRISPPLFSFALSLAVRRKEKNLVPHLPPPPQNKNKKIKKIKK